MKNWILVLCLLFTGEVFAFQTIYIVRHAEKQDDSKDPQLSLQGQKRAVDLALHLRDASVQAIYVSEYQRTQKTAAPLADLLKLQPAVMDSNKLEKFAIQLLADTSAGAALVVAHSNTVTTLLKALGAPVKWEIAENEFDRFVIVTPAAAAKTAAPIVNLIRY